MARGRSSDIRRELRKVIPEAEVNRLARETGAVRRQRQVRIYDLVWVLVLGFATGRKRTLAALRRRYERQTGQTIEESSFYKRFSPGLTKLFKVLLSQAFEECRGVGRSLTGPLAAFRDVILTDSTVIRLHDLLEKRFPACRTNHTKAALKAHAIMSVRGIGEHSIKVTAERDHDGPVFCVGPWVRGHLLMFDLGYFRYQLFASIGRNGGYFLTRLKGNADPTIVAVNRVHRGRAISLVGERLRDVVTRMKRQVLDVEVEVRFPRRRYAGRVHRDTQRLRVVGLLDRETGLYHLYVTNVPPEKLQAEDIGTVYSLRWQIDISHSRCCPPDLQVYVVPRALRSLAASGARDRQARLGAPAQLRGLAQRQEPRQVLSVGADRPRRAGHLIDLAPLHPATAEPRVERDGGHPELACQIREPPFVRAQRAA